MPKLNKSAINKIKREQDMFKDDAFCETTGGYVWFNPKNISQTYVMIIGPDDSPYQGGFFFIELNFQPNYPFSPPKAKYLTQWNNVRFNPNLYSDSNSPPGKVCLSILGTWDGPGWTPIMGLESIILAIRAQVMNDNPLNNEPCYSSYSRTNSDCINYNGVVSIATVKRAIIDALKGSIPVPDAAKKFFMDKIKMHFIKNFDNYVKRLNWLIENQDNRTYSLSYDRQRQTTNYRPLLEEIGNLYATLCST